MWSCTKCTEKHDDAVMTCWNCGTLRDGTEDPDFKSAEEHDAEAPPSFGRSLEDELVERFICDRCGYTEASCRRFSATGTGLTRVLDIESDQLIAISCGRCGFTEVFDPKPLEHAQNRAEVLDLLF